MKKLLAELATRELGWREEKTKEIITSQKYGLNVSASLKIDLPKNSKELPIVKNLNNSVKNIPVRPQSKLKKYALNPGVLVHNGNCLHAKRSKTEKSNTKRSIFNSIETTQDENEPPKQ